MQARDITEFQQRLVALAEMFNAKLSASRIGLYFDALKDLQLEDITRAMNQTVQTAKFMPLPAEIRALVVGDSEDVTEMAWIGMRKALSAVGSYASVAFADPALYETVVAMFGSWPNACLAELSPEMWSSKRKEFARVYRVYRARQLEGMRYLPGQCETSNAFHNQPNDHVPLALIGRSGDVERLSRGDAEHLRTVMAIQANGFAQLRDIAGSALEKFVGKSMDETA